MPTEINDPSLSEALEKECVNEWLDLPISRISFKDFANSTNETATVSSPRLWLMSENVSSEFRTFSFDAVAIDIIETSENKLQELQGKYPLGLINFYVESMPTVVLYLTEKTINIILQLLSQGSESLKIRVAIPKWVDKESKCLPLLSYQFFYERRLIESVKSDSNARAENNYSIESVTGKLKLFSLIFRRFFITCVFAFVLFVGGFSDFETIVLTALLLICLEVRIGALRNISVGHTNLRQSYLLSSTIDSNGNTIAPDVRTNLDSMDGSRKESNANLIADIVLYFVVIAIGIFATVDFLPPLFNSLYLRFS